MKKTLRISLMSVLLAACFVCFTFGMALLFRTRNASAAVKYPLTLKYFTKGVAVGSVKG